MRISACSLFPLAVLGLAAAACHRAAAPPPLAPVAPAPETVPLRLHPRVGQSRHVRVEMDNFMRFGAGELSSGDSARPTIHIVQFATESVTAVSGDTITVALITDSSRVETPGMQFLPPAMLDSLAPRGMTITTKMDSRGRTISTETKGSPRLDEQMAMARRMFPALDSARSPEASDGALGRLPDHPVRVGDTWADTSSLPRVLASGGGKAVSTYRFERIETRGGHRVAVISSEMVTPPMTVEQPMRVTTGLMHTAGELQIDLDAGWIVRRSMVVTASTHLEMGDMFMRMVTRQVPLEERP